MKGDHQQASTHTGLQHKNNHVPGTQPNVGCVNGVGLAACWDSAWLCLRNVPLVGSVSAIGSGYGVPREWPVSGACLRVPLTVPARCFSPCNQCMQTSQSPHAGCVDVRARATACAMLAPRRPAPQADTTGTYESTQTFATYACPSIMDRSCRHVTSLHVCADCTMLSETVTSTGVCTCSVQTSLRGWILVGQSTSRQSESSGHVYHTRSPGAYGEPIPPGAHVCQPRMSMMYLWDNGSHKHTADNGWLAWGACGIQGTHCGHMHASWATATSRGFRVDVGEAHHRSGVADSKDTTVFRARAANAGIRPVDDDSRVARAHHVVQRHVQVTK